MPWNLILIVVAIVLCLLAFWGYSPHEGKSLGWLGLALFMASFLFGG